VPFHQDGNERGRTVWICLDDIDSENGGLCVLPGWHKKGRMPLKMVSDPAELADAEYFASHNVYGVDVTKAEGCISPRPSPRLELPDHLEFPSSLHTPCVSPLCTITPLLFVPPTCLPTRTTDDHANDSPHPPFRNRAQQETT
jgi:hypothetical protein